jgi:adenylyltransferase and sulfurtransferase
LFGEEYAKKLVCHQEFKRVLDEHCDDELNIIDVRPPIEFGICQLPKSISTPYFIHAPFVIYVWEFGLDVPLDELVANPGKFLPKNQAVETYILCRLGNDSQIAAEALRGLDRKNNPNKDSEMVIKDVIGGLKAWTKEVDPEFPEY